MDTLSRRVERLLAAAGSVGTLAKYLADADTARLETFLADMARVDLEWLKKHRAALTSDHRPEPGDALVPLEPAVIDAAERPGLTRDGMESLSRGEWAELVFAGGAGTRFGGAAKGLVPVTPVLGRSFLELFAAQALAAGIECGRMPWLILLTSSGTSGPVSAWMNSAELQGFPRPALIELKQAEHPRLDEDGDIIADETGRIVVTGDGHGGAFSALLHREESGSLAARLRAADIRSIVLHNVDNAGANAFDPARLGLHRRSGKLLTLTVVQRAGPHEKVGLVTRNRATGRVEVVEYSACPRAVAESTEFSLAHVNTNLVELAAIRPDLPPTLYRHKSIRVSDREIVTSSLEMLNQHLAALLDPGRVGVVLLPRAEFFMPTKTRDAEDSLAVTQAALGRLAAEKLRRCGASVHQSAVVEVDPCVGSLDCTGWRIEAGARLALAVRHGAGGRPVVGSGLTVGRGATLRVVADLPYGRLQFDNATRAIREDGATAERASIGNNVTVVDGADVVVRGSPGAGTVVADNATLGGT